MSTTHHVITTVRHLQELHGDERKALLKLIQDCKDSDINHAALAMQAFRRIDLVDRFKARGMLALEFDAPDAEPVEGG